VQLQLRANTSSTERVPAHVLFVLAIIDAGKRQPRIRLRAAGPAPAGLRHHGLGAHAVTGQLIPARHGRPS